MKIHAIQTGTLRLRPLHRQMAGPKWLRYLGILTDRDWTESLPIFAWVIEHPEGLIVIDTGETARVFEPGHFGDAITTFYYKNHLQFDIDERREIGPQMRQLGLDPAEARRVIITHLHSDHTGGLYYFPNAEIFIARQELANPIGAATRSFPRWLKPRMVEYEDLPFGSFARSFPVTQAEDVVIVPTPGHSPGHQSVILRDGKDAAQSIIFAGDASFSDEQLINGQVAGVCYDVEQSRASNERLLDYMRAHPSIYLPAHDPDSARRLAERETLAV